MGTTCLRLPDELAEALDRLAAQRGTSRSAIIRDATEAYLAAEARAPRDRVSLLRTLVTYPGSGRGDLGERGETYLREMFRARRQRDR